MMQWIGQLCVLALLSLAVLGSDCGEYTSCVECALHNCAWVTTVECEHECIETPRKHDDGTYDVFAMNFRGDYTTHASECPNHNNCLQPSTNFFFFFLSLSLSLSLSLTHSDVHRYSLALFRN